MAVATAEIRALPRHAWTAPLIAYGAFTFACIVLLHPTALAMAGLWAGSSSYHHGVAVIPLALWMIFKQPTPAPSTSLLALGLLLAAASIWLAGRASGVALIEQFGFVSLLIAGAGVIFGMAAFRQWAFPFAFLYFMVPFGEVFVPALQATTASAAVGLLGFFGLPVSLDGYLIRTPVGAFEVAEACAGLNILLAASMIAAVFAYFSFGAWRKRLMFIGLAFAIAIGANAVRSFLLILIATLTEKQWAVGPDHLFIGFAVYAAALTLLVMIGRRMADATPPSTQVNVSAAQDWRMQHIVPAFLIIVVAAFYAQSVIDRSVARTAPASISLINAPGWRILPPPQNWTAQLAAADRASAATYATSNQQVYVSIGYFTHDRRGAEIVNSNNRAWDGGEWRRNASLSRPVTLFGQEGAAAFTTLAGPDRRRLGVVTVYWLDDRVFFDPWRMKLAQMRTKLAGANPQGGVIMIAASYTAKPEESLGAIRAFAEDAEPLADWQTRNKGL